MSLLLGLSENSKIQKSELTNRSILVVGTKNSGKTSFINFLNSSLASSKKLTSTPPKSTAFSADSSFTSQYLETEIDSERIGLTLWDSPGLEADIVDLQLKEMALFLESKFEETFNEEQKVIRATGVRDSHIHCVFLVLDPTRLDANIAAARKASGVNRARVVGGLDEDLDLQVLRTLQGKTTVIPVVSKADTITSAHMSFLKRTVWDSLKLAKLDPLESLELADNESDIDGQLDERDEHDEETHSELSSYSADRDSGFRSASNPSSPPMTRDSGPRSNPSSPQPEKKSTPQRRTSHRLSSSSMGGAVDLPYLPMSIISPDMYDPGVVGRRFPWGFADPYNSEHCDFVRLKDSVFSEWRGDLREASRERWYEGWRTSRLKQRDRASSKSLAGPGTRMGMKSPSPAPAVGVAVSSR